MSFMESMDSSLRSIRASQYAKVPMVERALIEIEVAGKFARLFPENEAAWQALILQATQALSSGVMSGGAVDLDGLVAGVEETLSHVGQAMKHYTVHCVGHAHIDMNWMWPWQETVSVTHDTFTTVDKLMDHFPEFVFSQSQASTYAAMEEYCPEVFETIKRRIAEGRWEPTASMWVEGDKNLASGEILCRHMLYTRIYLKEKFGLPYDAVKIDWECDTFGHCHTLPSILNRGGVTRYYRHRTGPDNWLLWWEAPDSSRVLTFYDKGTYNGTIDPQQIGNLLVGYVDETGLKDFMFVYGVGDHGGGPTMRDLVKAREIDSWPIFPTVKLSTTDAFFSAIEPVAGDIPVFDDELNFVFEGCYTSESSIKTANRISENLIPEVETLSVISGALTGFQYPQEEINKAWRLAMFNQFHDILPGSGIHETYTYSDGLFQEILATTGAIRTRALRRLASQINTSAAAGTSAPVGTGAGAVGDGLGAGAGDLAISGGVSAYNMGAVTAEPVIVFNQLAFARSGVVEAKVWNKEIPSDRVIVRDEQGNTTAGQVVGSGQYWSHNYTTVAFPVKDVPAVGYRTYTVDVSAEAQPQQPKLRVSYEGRNPHQVIEHVPGTVTMPANNIMENDYVVVEIDIASGAVKHLIDKATGFDYVPEGELLGVLEIHEEMSNIGMSAWTIGDIKNVRRLDFGGRFTHPTGPSELDPIPHWMAASGSFKGPHKATVRTTHKVGESTIIIEVTLCADSSMVDFDVKTMWLERGNPNTVPMLRVAFPVRITEPKATYEIAFGSISRPTDGHEVPALRWADLSGNKPGVGGECGITLVNSDKYGHSADGSTLRLTLLRSSYEPDPLPEIGRHSTRFAVIPHAGPCSVSDAMRAGASYNLPMNVASTDVHDGPLAPSAGFIEVIDSNVMLASAKKAEGSDSLVLRLYEVQGVVTQARVKLDGVVKQGASAVEVDLMEEPLAQSSAILENDTLLVNIPAYGIATVRIG